MMRSLHLDHEARWLDGSYFLEVMVTTTGLTDWCLNLMMLLTEVVDLVTLEEEGGRTYLEVRIDKRYLPGQGGAVHIEDGIVRLSVGEQEVMYWLSYYLTYVRDGMVGADHIDSDYRLNPEDPYKRVFIEFKAADVAPPISLEEARALGYFD